MLEGIPPTRRAAREHTASGAASVIVHLVGGAFALWIASLPPRTVSPSRLQTTQNVHLVWLAEPGPGGGGGGGGNKMLEPPKKAELPGKEKLTVPAMKPPTPQVTEKPEESKPNQTLNIPARTLGAEMTTAPGTIESPPTPNPESQGAGSGGGAGDGNGTGIGSGEGSGFGSGFGGGTGGGAYRPGSGVSMPQLVREVRPEYTADAMRAKVQGAVLLECIVLPDGSVGQIKILKSLDKVFGLDDEAIKAAKQWQFVPGRRFGEAVPVLVTLELSFTLR